MSDTVFENWFCAYFVSAVSSKTKPVFLWFDGHGSHLMDLYQMKKEIGAVPMLVVVSVAAVCLPLRFVFSRQTSP